MKSRSFSFMLFKIGLLLSFLHSLHAWFTWDINPQAISLISIALCSPHTIIDPKSFLISRRNLISIVILIIAKIICEGGNSLNQQISSILTISPVVLTICLRSTYKVAILSFLTNSLSIILFFSLSVWILIISGIKLPSMGKVSHPAWELYVYENYFFCLRNTLLYDIRFCSIFLEPGHLGMIASFMLFANKFEIKRKSVLVILLSALFTLSLAAYVLVLVSFSVYVAISSKHRATYFTTWLILLLSGYYFFTSFNSGNNIVNEQIISRLAYDDSQGDFVGNNRFSQNMDQHFSKYIETSAAWFGIGSEKYASMNFGPNSGYKVFILKHGIVGTILIFFFYLFQTLTYRNLYSLAFLVVYVLAFLQRSYPFWACQLLIFLTALPHFTFLQKNEKQN